MDTEPLIDFWASVEGIHTSEDQVHAQDYDFESHETNEDDPYPVQLLQGLQFSPASSSFTEISPVSPGRHLQKDSKFPPAPSQFYASASIGGRSRRRRTSSLRALGANAQRSGLYNRSSSVDTSKRFADLGYIRRHDENDASNVIEMFDPLLNPSTQGERHRQHPSSLR